MNSRWPEATNLLLSLNTTSTAPVSVIAVDPGLAEHDITSAVARWLRAHHHAVRILPVGPCRSLSDYRSLGERVAGGTVVAVGGGTVVDTVKIATLLAASPVVEHHLDVPQRSGAVLLPIGVRRPHSVIAVPTTLGTGAEAAAVAVLDEPRGRRLVMGPALRPEAAIRDPLATDRLPAHLLREGVVEILARFLGPYVGDPCRHAGLTDALVEAAVRECVLLGERCCRAGHASPSDRGAIAGLSAFGHSEYLQRLHNPWGSRLWPLANELATVARTRKVTATVALLPHVWEAVLSGRAELGSPARVHRIFEVITEAATGVLPKDPPEGIRALISSWQVNASVVVSPEQLTEVTQRATRAWGGGLPALGGLDTKTIRHLYVRATQRPEPMIA